VNQLLESIIKRDPAAKSKLYVILTYPGVKAIFFHKIANFFSIAKFDLIARIISQFSRFLTGIEIHPKAKIGKNLFIDHGLGVVIGETSIIGNNVLIYHGVTLGGTSLKKGKRHPTINDDAIIGAGAKILGPITIGKQSRVGANAVVTRNVESFTTVMGIPAKVIKKNDKKNNKNFIDLTEKEFYFLFFLLQGKGAALTKKQLLNKVWNLSYNNSISDTRVVETLVSRIRKKFKKVANPPKIIKDSLGYKLLI